MSEEVQGPVSASDLDKSVGRIEAKLFVDGRLEPSSSSACIEGRNPATGIRRSIVPVGSQEDVERVVASADKSFSSGSWRSLPPSRKKAILHRWADLIESRATHLNAVDALEMGKPVSLKTFDASAAARLVRFHAEAVDKWFGDVFTSDSTSTVIQKRTPRGVVGAIVPWNFPSYNAVLKAAPALAAGNSVIVKPSELASLSAILLAELATEAGVPPGVLNVAPGEGATVGRGLAEHLNVDMISFTGSTRVGQLIVQYAGASNMKNVSAECGGKSPQIVFEDFGKLDLAADAVARSIMLNQGQVCSTGSRLLVQDAVHDSLIEKIIERLKIIVSGDPLSAETTYGPLASETQFAKVLHYIETAADSGARLASGGTRIANGSGGFFVEPTIFVDVPEQAAVAHEEIFGPVLSVFRFRDIDEAIRLARSTVYGLAAYVWTSSLETGFKMANALDTGVTFVNAIAPAGEGPAQAFSGEPFGLSGIGVDGGMAGLETYMRRQTLWFNHG